jgi:hypothetical protein
MKADVVVLILMHKEWERKDVREVTSSDERSALACLIY